MNPAIKMRYEHLPTDSLRVTRNESWRSEWDREYEEQQNMNEVGITCPAKTELDSSMGIVSGIHVSAKMESK